jgi:hypothetical protein
VTMALSPLAEPKTFYPQMTRMDADARSAR